VTSRAWLITGVSSGFGRELTSQLLDRGDRVIGTVRDTSKIADLAGRYPDTFVPEVLEMTDRTAVRHLVDRAFGQCGRVDAIVSNAGYGLFGAAEELSDDQVEVAQEVAPFGIGVTIVEPGGARTEFRYRSARVADLMPEYEGNPAHAFQRMLDPANGIAPGDPARMAARIIDSVGTEPAPLRMVLGSQALEGTIGTLRQRIEDFEQQTGLAASTDFPPGE
jgi:NAD(P)-dependent dehydrogenase (short-subunit alcohol dehydrogenase family)